MKKYRIHTPLSFKDFFIASIILTGYFLSPAMLHADDNGGGPNLFSFTSSTQNGTYGTGAMINITANFDTNLDPSTNPVLNITLDDGEGVALNSVSGSSLSGTYTVQSGDTSSNLTVASMNSNSGIQDFSGDQGNAYNNLPGQNLGNSSSIIVDGTPPNLSTVVVDGNALTLAYNTTLDSGSVPATTDFVVNVNSSPVTVSSINVSGSTVVLTLLNPTSQSDTVTLDYNPGTNVIKDPLGNVASSFSGMSVTNSTPDPFIANVAGTIYSLLVGHNLYITADVNIYVVDVDPTSPNYNTIIATIPITGGGFAFGMTAVGKYIYVAGGGGYTGNDVFVVDADPTSPNYNTVVDTITVENAPLYVARIGMKVYSVNNIAGSVSVIDADPASINYNTVLTTIHGLPGAYAIATVGTDVYVGDGNGIDVIDSNNVLSTIPSSGRIAATSYFSIVGKKLYINGGSSNMIVVDADPTSPSYNTVIANISVGTNPGYSSVVGTKLYVNNGGDNTVSVIDTSNFSGSPGGTVIATIPVGTTPEYSVAVGNKLYVTNYGSNNVSVINTNTDSVTATIPAGGSPGYESAVGTKLYVENATSNDVSVINTLTDSELNVNAPVLQTITSTSADGRYTSGQSVNLTATFNQTLGAGSKMRLTLNTGAVIDLDTVSGSTLTGTYVVGSNDSTPDLSVTSISNDPSFTDVSDAFASNSSYSIPTSPELTGDSNGNLGDFSNIVIGSSTPIAISVGTQPYQLATVGNLVYVANQGSDTVSVINTLTNTATTTISVGSQPYGVVYNTTTKEIYVTNLNDNTVSVIAANPSNGTFNTVTHTITVGETPYYVTSLGTNIYVTNHAGDSVSVIDTGSHTVTATIPVGSGPLGIKASGTNLYVANFGSGYGSNGGGTVSVINSLNNTVTDTITVGNGGRGVAVNGSEVYVTNYSDGTISVINTGTNTVTNTITVGNNPRGILSLGSNIYVENYGDGTISVINTSTHTVTGTYAVGNTPAGMATAPNGTDIYVSRFTDGEVSIFNTLNDTLEVVGPTATSPTVTSQAASSIGTTTATLNGTITVSGNASSTIEGFYFGTTTSYGFTASSTGTFGLGAFAKSLTGLIPGTTYHFEAFAVNSAGTSTSGDLTFSTNANASSTAPIISSISSGTPTASGTVITWTTDQAADSLVEYGTTTAYAASSTYSGSLVTSHSVSLSNLIASTLYHFRVISANASSTLATSTDNNFSTIAVQNNSGGSTPPPTGGSSGGGEQVIIYPTTNPVYVPPANIPGCAVGFICVPNITTTTTVNTTTAQTSVPTPSAKSTKLASTILSSPATLKALKAEFGSSQFTHDLTLNSTGADVYLLQRFLNIVGFTVAPTGAGSYGHETKTFGARTKTAVTFLQISAGIAPTVGYFGPVTRAWVNVLLKQANALKFFDGTFKK